MSLDQITAKVSKLITDNSPNILTGIGVVGTLGTAVLAAKASFKASEKIREGKPWDFNEYDKPAPKPLTNSDKIKLVWMLYIPSATTAGLTVAAIIGANRVGLRRTAAMAALYAGSNDKFKEYKDKVAKHIGDQKEQNVHDDIAQDHVNRKPSSEVVIIGAGQVMCFDIPSARYFYSDMETIKQAMNNVNYRALNYGSTTVTDFYDQLNLPRTKFSDDIGWKGDQLMEITFSTTMSDDQKPCLAIDYFTEPVRDFERAH